ncbi:MAG: glutamine amidotransferase-related protein [Janthinobacterium lividum]
MLYLVEDESDLPAHYGALAALLADALHATLRPLPAALDETRFPDAVQHVTRDQGLAPSGLIWAERLGVMPGSRAADDAGADGIAPAVALLAAARTRDIVVPLHPRVMGDRASADAWRTLAATYDVPVQHCRVLRENDDARLAGQPEAGNVVDGVARLIDSATGRDVPILGVCRQDRFGRWSASPPRFAGEHPAAYAAASTTTPTTAHTTAPTTARTPPATPAPATPARLRIALIGSEGNQREVYPATLAALGDALDAACVDSAAVELVFIAPETLRMPNAAAALAGCDGILLPGGADMRAVPGQVVAARHGWLSGTPVVGLCLGMQTMATAVLQAALGAEDVGLAEVDANVRVPSFVPMAREPLPQTRPPFPPSSPSSPSSPFPLHRVGEHRMQVVDGSCLEAILDGRHGLRYNHRYRLNPALYAALMAAGVSVAARDETGAIVDAIEARGHPFFIGMQGHPEQSSAPGQPHPLLRAFVDAARMAAALR